MAGVLAIKLQESKRDLTTPVARTDRRSDHVTRTSLSHGRAARSRPLLIEGVADYVENPAAEIGVDIPVVAKGDGARHASPPANPDAYEILKGTRISRRNSLHLLRARDEGTQKPCENGKLMACGFHELYRAVTIIQQSTMGHFLLLADKNVSEREERLRGVNRVISHEIKNRIGAVLGASSVLHEVPDIAASKRVELVTNYWRKRA